MRHIPLLLACAVLLAAPVRAQEEEEREEAGTEEATTEAPAAEAPPAAPVRRAGQPFHPGARKAPTPSAAPASASGGACSRQASEEEEGGHSLGGAGIGRDSTESRERFPVRSGGAANSSAGAGGAGGGEFQVIDIGLLPTIAQVTGAGSGGGRPVVHLAGGKKWAIKIQHKGSGRANFNILLGGTNGNLTGGGKYRYRAAISRSKGAVSGSGASCVGQMHNAAYTTCQQPCSMAWDLRFGTPPKERRGGGTCELEHGQVYYLNVAPEGNGCSGGEAEGFGCPLVMEVSNGGVLTLNPSGPAAACAHRGFGYDPSSGCR